VVAIQTLWPGQAVLISHTEGRELSTQRQLTGWGKVRDPVVVVSDPAYRHCIMVGIVANLVMVGVVAILIPLQV
jgi:hypothetical protein